MEKNVKTFGIGSLPNTITFHCDGSDRAQNILWIAPTIRFTFAKHRPNLWRRFWYWALLGWRWEKPGKKGGKVK